ncbi:MAG: RNA polymerase sigma factor [Chloroflexi bacterium]|nr:RNA polymerase sigma factor [Chloroflexota bacterium]
MEGRPPDESTLIARAQRNDVAAYEKLMLGYQQAAFRAAYLVLRDAAEAEDVIQDAFIKAYHALGRFDAGRPFKPWLLRIVVNEALNARKAAQRRRKLAQTYFSASGSDDAAPSLEAAALGGERRELLMRALDMLKDDARLVISLRYFMELSEQEMAEVLHCPRGTVKSRLNRALDSLRRVVREHFPGLEPEGWSGEHGGR